MFVLCSLKTVSEFWMRHTVFAQRPRIYKNDMFLDLIIGFNEMVYDLSGDLLITQFIIFT